MPKSKLIREKLDLLASLADEIGNPLTAINARLYSLEKSLPAESPAHEDLAAVNKELRRLEGALKQFLQDFRSLLTSEADSKNRDNV